MKTTLVTTEIPIQTGGIGTFVWNFARLLRSAQQDVHIVLANPTTKPRRQWIGPFDELGITVSELSSKSLEVPAGYTWHQRVAEITSSLIPDDTDIIYLADWQAKGFDFVRNRRFNGRQFPVVVTVLHGCTQWLREGMRTLPISEEEIGLDFAESYMAQYSDFVVSPGHYLLNWVREKGWKLPSEAQQRVLGYPFFPPVNWELSKVARRQTSKNRLVPGNDGPSVKAQTPELVAVNEGGRGAAWAKQSGALSVGELDPGPLPPDVQTRERVFKRIVFFGRLETRKGIELFINALGNLRGKPCLQQVQEIVLLGGLSANIYGGPRDMIHALQAKLGKAIAIKVITNLNTFQAQSYLLKHIDDTLVVVPSLRENFPLVVIETSLIPGLNLICSSAGSIPEIVGPEGSGQLFEPFLQPFTKKLEATLVAGPRSAEQLAKYNWKAANQRWLDFHDEVCAYAQAKRREQECSLVSKGETSSTRLNEKSVDVCISYYNLGPYLPYMLESLSRQTSQDFNVIVVNDGSTDPASIDVFEKMSRAYQERGWRFVTTENHGLSAARNTGAALGNAEYIIFIDGDDIVPPTMVERFLQSIRCSGDDCLTCYFHLFRGEGWDNAYLDQSPEFYAPIGNAPLLGVLSNPFGGACCIIRRTVFTEIEGFTSDISRHVGFEDYEFFTRLSLAGFTLDVIPECLLFYRIRDNGMFRTNDLYENKVRVLRVYEERLKHVGLDGLAELTAGMHQFIRRGDGDAAFYVNHVSGYFIWKILRIKIKNQLVRRLKVPAAVLRRFTERASD